MCPAKDAKNNGVAPKCSEYSILSSAHDSEKIGRVPSKSSHIRITMDNPSPSFLSLENHGKPMKVTSRNGAESQISPLPGGHYCPPTSRWVRAQAIQHPVPEESPCQRPERPTASDSQTDPDSCWIYNWTASDSQTDPDICHLQLIMKFKYKSYSITVIEHKLKSTQGGEGSPLQTPHHSAFR